MEPKNHYLSMIAEYGKHDPKGLKGVYEDIENDELIQRTGEFILKKEGKTIHHNHLAMCEIWKHLIKDPNHKKKKKKQMQYIVVLSFELKSTGKIIRLISITYYYN